MATFKLTSGAVTLDFDAHGGVFNAGAVAGSWTTNRANQIQVTKTDATQVNFDVTWVFNANNQLTVQSPAGTEVFNFTTGPVFRNSFTTLNCVLQVKPDLLNPFTFQLHGDWDMDPNHNLTFTITGKVSTINGFVSDPLGRFMYHFSNKANSLQTNVLGFAGSWQSKSDASGTPLLEFHYQKETKPDGTPGVEGVFSLPKSVAITRSTNQLAYTYTKDNQTISINFQGTLMVGPDFQISYVVQRQVSSTGAQMVGSTTLGFSALIAKPNLHGDLEVTLTKADGTAGNTTLTIGGAFQGVLGKTALQVGFAFQQSFGPGNTISRTAAFNGQLQFSGGQVQWTFTTTGTTINLAVGADIKFGSVSADGRLNLTVAGGQVVGVTFLLGVNF